ncbi:MAG: hypothetical protein R3D85_03000 [Paracoccaceae bacterium]
MSMFILHHPDEEREAARPPAPRRPMTGKRRWARSSTGERLERPNYYAPQGFDDHAARSFRRGGWWQYAVEEAKAIREGVGLIDATAFTKHEGVGATAFLDWFTCNKLPRVGRINLTYADRRRHDADGIYHRAARRGRLLPRLGRRLVGV